MREPSKMRHATPVKPTVPNATKKRLPWTKRMLDLLCAAIAEKRAHCLHKWVDIGGGEFCAHCSIKKRETP